MSQRTWVILGATSIISEEFARLAARAGHPLILIARQDSQTKVIAQDIHHRYQVTCDTIHHDFTQPCEALITQLNALKEYDLFIAQSQMTNNAELTQNTIAQMIQVNVTSTAQIIHAYLQKEQGHHRLIFLSSVASNPGRAKNSLYGATKAAIEVYLQGCQQNSRPTQHITLARLGFIDTHTTYGQPGIFYASSPKKCAKACWKASLAGKRLIIHPFFWRQIMFVFRNMPFLIFKKLSTR